MGVANNNVVTGGHNGLTAEQIFGGGQGRTFDDVNILPVFAQAKEVDLRTLLAQDFGLNMPVVSSPMDTVTEADTAIQMALHGGLGFIHFNQSLEKEAEQVERVKRYQMGIVNDPVCRRLTDPISEVYAVKERHGFSTLLITEDGTAKSRLLGMVTRGHVDLESDKSISLGQVMTPVAKLATCPRQSVMSIEQARQVLRRERSTSKLVLLNDDGSVGGLVTVTDVRKTVQFPRALLDKATGQLRVGAAVSTQDDDVDRAEALIKAGVDVLVVDSAQGGTGFAVRRIKQILEIDRKMFVVAGNVVTPDQAAPLIKAGARALRVGMGSGSICVTQDELGIGGAQLSAVYRLARYVREEGLRVPIIADGGIRNAGDAFKAFACGASTVMVGRLVAGCDETPAREVDIKGRGYKRYRGMGSKEAMEAGGHCRYASGVVDKDNLVAQGVSGLVPAAGPLSRILLRVFGALRLALGYCDCSSIDDLHTMVGGGRILFELRSQAARQEGSPHDVLQV